MSADVLEKLTLMLAPFAPYMAQEIWEEMGRTGPVFRQAWPHSTRTRQGRRGGECVVQVNGKLRSRSWCRSALAGRTGAMRAGR